MVPLEFLLINGAKLDTKDDRGQSALHHATLLGHTGYVTSADDSLCAQCFLISTQIDLFNICHFFTFGGFITNNRNTKFYMSLISQTQESGKGTLCEKNYERYV